MKRILTAVLLLTCFVSFGQTLDTTKLISNLGYGQNYKRWKVDSNLIIPKGGDTTNKTPAQIKVIGNKLFFTNTSGAWTPPVIPADTLNRWPSVNVTYANPAWIASLPYSKINSTPTTLTGYGITDAATLSQQQTNTAAISANSTAISAKLNYIDTVSMLAPYRAAISNTSQVLTDASTVTWDYNQGSIAEVTINSTRNISVTNLSGVKFGTLRVKHGVAGTQIVLPGNTYAVGWNPLVYNAGTQTGFTDLGFYYNGSTYAWYSNVYPTVATDTQAPSFVSATVDNTNYARVILTYNETLLNNTGFVVGDFTLTGSTTGAHTVSSVSVSGVNIYILTTVPFSAVETVTLSGGSSKIKDLAGNVGANLSGQSVTIPAQTILAGAGGLSVGTGSLLVGGVATLEYLNYNAATKVTTAGTVNTIKFNLATVPAGVSIYIRVWRKVSTTYNLIGSQTYAAASLSVGTNALSVSSPFAVQVGDYVGLGYSSGGSSAFINGTAGTSGDLRYQTGPASPTTGFDWDGKTAAVNYSVIQLLQ